MRSSDPDSKTDLLDMPNAVEKLWKAVCVPKTIQRNGVIAFMEHVVFRAMALKSGGKARFVVARREGEPLVYESVQKLKGDYEVDILTPQLLKSALTVAINELLDPIRAEFAASEEWQAIERQEYSPEKAAVQVKKQKDKGDPARRAAATAARKGAGVVTMPDGHVEGSDAEKVTPGGNTEETLRKLYLDDKKKTES